MNPSMKNTHSRLDFEHSLYPKRHWLNFVVEIWPITLYGSAAYAMMTSLGPI
jgi:hypothetical protein